MSPADLIEKAKGQGVQLQADGQHLRCKYRRGLPEDLKAELVTHKPVLLAYLTGLADGAVCRINSPSDLPSEWRLEWEDRAAIMEYDGGLSREQAEHLAFQEILRQMGTEQQESMSVRDRADRTISKNQ